jgi:hypothetical protein
LSLLRASATARRPVVEDGANLVFGSSYWCPKNALTPIRVCVVLLRATPCHGGRWSSAPGVTVWGIPRPSSERAAGVVCFLIYFFPSRLNETLV